MTETIAILVPLIITILGNVLIAWVEIKGKNKPKGQQPKRFLSWLLLVFCTLIIPTLIITWVIVQIFARLLLFSMPDMNTPSFVLFVAFSVGTVGSLWPLGWGVLLYPIFDALLDQIYPFPEIINDQSSEEDNSSTSEGEKS